MIRNLEMIAVDRQRTLFSMTVERGLAPAV